MIHTMTLTLNVMPFNCSYNMGNSTLWRKTCLVYEEGNGTKPQSNNIRKVK